MECHHVDFLTVLLPVAWGFQINFTDQPAKPGIFTVTLHLMKPRINVAKRDKRHHKIGGQCRTRTYNLCLVGAALYPVELIARHSGLRVAGSLPLNPMSYQQSVASSMVSHVTPPTLPPSGRVKEKEPKDYWGPHRGSNPINCITKAVMSQT